MAFETLATRKNAKLRLALTGTAGEGKTHGALLFAGAFGTKIGVMDSERGSSKKVVGLSGIPPFFLECLEEKNVQEYLEKIGEAAAAGVDVLVIDSYSHSWIGALETVDKMGGSKFSNGWKVVSPMVTKLVDSILNYPGHVIATMRSKGEYVTEQINGKSVPRKVGMGVVARDGTEFEFDVILDLSGASISAPILTVSKTRCQALDGKVFERADIPKIANTLKTWLGEGAPELAVDVLTRQVKFASSQDELAALIPALKELAPEDLVVMRAVYLARKNELADATGGE